MFGTAVVTVELSAVKVWWREEKYLKNLEGSMQKQAAVNYSDGRYKPIVEKCEGCERVVENAGARYCQSYLNPAAKWKLGFCNFATHAKPEIAVAKIRINPLKAAKRASKSKK
jgi:hypothetical protein